jgi:hypothetical protein
MTDSSLNPINIYIGALIENLDKNNIPKEIDLIIDSGAFNGGYGYGIILYLKELEKLKLLKINRISGCSIGALLGAVYLINETKFIELLYNKILTEFRETCFLNNLPNLIRNYIENADFDIEIFNNRLYVTYYDTTIMKQKVINQYKDKEELIEILIRTSYIPYMINSSLQYKEKYIDGITPYFFPKFENKVLCIELCALRNMFSSLYIKNEINIYSRLLEGILDINNFFSKSNNIFVSKYNTLFCNYIDNWKLCNYIMIKFRDIFAIFIILFIKISLFVKNNICKNSVILSNLENKFLTFYKYILRYTIL